MIRWRRLAGLLLGMTLAAGPVQAKCRLDVMGELPVTMHATQPIAPASINGRDVSFLVDTGAFFSTMSAANARELGLGTYPAPFGLTVTGVGGNANATLTRVKSFTLAKQTLSNVEFIVLGEDSGQAAVGVIGQNILGIADLDLDFADGAVRIMQAQGCWGTPLAYWGGGKAYSVIPIQATSPGQTMIHGVVQVNGKPVHALFDTGASSSMISPAAAARAGVRTDGPDVRRAGVTRGVGSRTVPIWTAPFASIQIGDEQVKNTRLYIGQVGQGQDEMLVGADFFLSHRVYVAHSQSKMYFSYTGGPVFDLTRPPRLPAGAGPGPQPAQVAAASPRAPPAAAAAAAAAVGAAPAASPAPPPSAAAGDPTDAGGFSRRGAARAAQRDYAGAVADFDRAIALAPDDPTAYDQRAAARLASGQPFLAMADLDAVIRLKPGDAQAHLTRATLKLRGHDREGARADLDAAAAAAPKEANLRLQLAGAYAAMDQFPLAVAQYGLWIAAHPDDASMADARNGRCRARALGDIELDAALADCNAAVRLAPQRADPLDSRGLVHVRRGEFDRAVADYDAALALRPKSAWSLYGRALAEAKAGDKSGSDADLAAAAALAPKLATRAARLGLSP